MLKSRNVGGIEIFRSSQAHENRVYKRIRDAVFKRFSPGVYIDKSVIVSIVNLMYDQYYKILDEYLPKVDSREFVSFLTAEYERYGKVADAYKLNKLSADDEELWGYAGHARRAIKHILELLCISRMDDSKIAASQEEQEDAISMVFIAAEELISLYQRSDGYQMLHDEVTLKLDPNEHTYFNVEQDGSIKFDIRESVQGFSKYIPSPMFLNDSVAHGEILDASFVEMMGLSYKNTIETIGWIIDTYSNREQPEEAGGFIWEEAVATMAGAFGITPSQAELIIDGFSLSAESMEERVLFRPKQEFRAYKRAFFKDRYNGVTFVFFSRRMAFEALGLLVADVPFRKLPSEWRSKSVSKALDALSLKAGRWFEKVVEQNLGTIGITGSASVKTLITSKTERLKIPAEVGEIDFIGFHEAQKLLVVIEVKQVGFATEAKMFRDDIYKFTEGADSYSAKFIKKYNWVVDNVESIERHFFHRFNLTTKLDFAGYAMITLYPTIVSTRIEEFSCVSLSEFMNRCKANEAWPFSKTSL